MVCKGICINYQVDEPQKKLEVDEGIKSCSFCKRYLKWFDKKCPCCKTTLSKNENFPKKDRHHQNFIYKKFLFKLNLSKKIVNEAKNLEDNLLEKADLDISPHTLATACIYITTHNEQTKPLEEILGVFKIPEVDLRYCMEKITEKIPPPTE